MASVIDSNGKGIEQDKLEEMFKNFTRDPNADLYDGASTSGLELAITKRLVDLQNGKKKRTGRLEERFLILELRQQKQLLA